MEDSRLVKEAVIREMEGRVGKTAIFKKKSDFFDLNRIFFI